MQISQDLLYEYQLLLLGRIPSIQPDLFDGEARQKERAALDIVRYAVENLLRWSPKEMAAKFNDEVITRLKLTKIVSYITFPPEADKKRDYFVYAHKLYPHIIPMNLYTLTILTYNNVHEKHLVKFPKGFFDDNLGRTRALLCMNHALSSDRTVRTKQELYKMFTETTGMQFIQRHRLDLARRLSWETPLDFMHESLAPNDRDEMWYHYYKLKMKMRQVQKEMEGAGGGKGRAAGNKSSRKPKTDL
jgi:hypothetical protein